MIHLKMLKPSSPHWFSAGKFRRSSRWPGQSQGPCQVAKSWHEAKHAWGGHLRSKQAAVPSISVMIGHIDCIRYDWYPQVRGFTMFHSEDHHWVLGGAPLLVAPLHHWRSAEGKLNTDNSWQSQRQVRLRMGNEQLRSTEYWVVTVVIGSIVKIRVTGTRPALVDVVICTVSKPRHAEQ